jgi:methylenetetrahydrofolate dehydrogenase (NADP+)/methenyltetrahydrofolate cyclohydrolase/formyltetrahydrofolate synthetase
VPGICEFYQSYDPYSRSIANGHFRYALAADIQTIPGLPTAPGYLNVDVDPITGEIDGLF